jgi:tRNA G26 N,N-dimethylase Trm1
MTSYSNYGGVSTNTSWSHESALRLVLGSLSNAAARYGRYITPLVSFSIDFYVRVFVRVDSKASEVKKTARYVSRSAYRADEPAEWVSSTVAIIVIHTILSLLDAYWKRNLPMAVSMYPTRLHLVPQ